MHKNLVWLGFLAMVFGAVIWVTIKAIYMFYLYTSLNATVSAENLNWSIEQLSDERFAMKAHYIYEVEERAFNGETVFKNDIYRNPLAAEDALKVYSQKDWTAWYSVRNPQYSSLQKNFPLKEFLSATVLWIIMLYFFGLGYYAAQKR